MQLSLLDFLPSYPLYDSKNLYPKIDSLKELKRLEPIEPPKQIWEKGSLLQHQKNLARLMSSKTDFNVLVVMHETGTGKSCVAFSISEISKIKNSKFSQNKTVVITPNQDVATNMKNELIKCTGGIYDANMEIESYIPKNYYRLQMYNWVKKQEDNYIFLWEEKKKQLSKLKYLNPRKEENMKKEIEDIDNKIENNTFNPMIDYYTPLQFNIWKEKYQKEYLQLYPDLERFNKIKYKKWLDKFEIVTSQVGFSTRPGLNARSDPRFNPHEEEDLTKKKKQQKTIAETQKAKLT